MKDNKRLIKQWNSMFIVCEIMIPGSFDKCRNEQRHTCFVYKIACAPTDDLDQLAHPHILSGTSAIRLKTA